MDNEEVLDFDVDDDDGIDIEHNDSIDILDDSPIPDTTTTTNPDSSAAHYYFPDGDLLEPYDGLEFESEESAKAFYNSYARRVGFSTRVSSSRRSRRDGAIIQRQFVCAKEGFRNMNEKRTKDREIKRPRTVTRVGCKASLSVKMHDSSGKWIVSGFVKEHNHELVPPDQVHCLRSHRQISGPAKTLIDTLQAAGMGPRRIMSALIKEYGGISKVGFTEVDCRNYMRNNRQKSIQGEIQLLLDYLRQMNSENPTFFYAVQRSEDNHHHDHQSVVVGNVFWADPKAILDFAYFGDTVTFDTTYRSNRYRLPFAPFTGVNHHGQPVLFGCAFIVNETEASFVWLFKTWLAAMSAHAARSPVSITTDHDAVIRAAVVQVFPEARHRFCKWHIFKKCQEKLSHVFLRHPAFESDFHKSVNLTDSVEDFESCWFSLLDKYELRDHDWLQALYSDRRQWVPVYLRDTFFAEMSSTQRSDSINSYFDGYINASTNLTQFFKLYEKALESRLEKEVKADYDTMNSPPVLKTPSPMEKQASELYTRKLFTRFQEELVGTLTFMASKADDDGDLGTYQVAKYGETHKAHCVKFNILEMRANCSCQMFEFSGIVCRHILAVFRVTNLLTLPPYYILKRWTRNAKSSVIFDDYGLHAYDNYLESHTVRYNTLRHKAFNFVQEAGKSIYTCDVALVALQEAAKTVSLEMKNEVRRTMANGHVKGSSASDGEHIRRSEECQQEEPEDEMDKKIIELRHELELANRKCEAYRTNLLSVLKELEDQKLQVSIKVQNIKISLKDSL
ncbi:protein FAR1-RELATED SEQUENCE 5 [Raphanus sativus]|uniref:Protein FAR1-RELATED SEQUENCE n=1 Tax=Raphanus sativus TaxID=3726 RepID=A0A6J0MX41_RAPSA|nr:protein FAR1-RELATED SEQUENCE 5 [Raphanus sativus]